MNIDYDFCRIFEDFCLKRRGVQSSTLLRICVKKCNEHDISDKSCIFALTYNGQLDNDGI